MPKKRYFIAVPADVYKDIKNVKNGLKLDLKRFTGRDVSLTMPKLMKATFSKPYSDFIQFDLNKVSQLARERRTRWKYE